MNVTITASADVIFHFNWLREEPDTLNSVEEAIVNKSFSYTGKNLKVSTFDRGVVGDRYCYGRHVESRCLRIKI